MTTAAARSGHGLALGLVAASTVLGLMGTDLVLPAVPSLPEALGGDAAAAQVLAAACALLRQLPSALAAAITEAGALLCLLLPRLADSTAPPPPRPWATGCGR